MKKIIFTLIISLYFCGCVGYASGHKYTASDLLEITKSALFFYESRAKQ